MAGLHEAGGNLFDIPPLEDFGFDDQPSLNLGTKNVTLPSGLGNAPITNFDPFPTSPPPLTSMDSFGDLPPLNFGEDPSNSNHAHLMTGTVADDDAGFGDFTSHEMIVPPMLDKKESDNSGGTLKDNEDFGNFVTSNEEFGNFAVSKLNDEFGNFATSKPSEDKEFATSKLNEDEEFGNFTTNGFGNFAANGSFATSKLSEDEEFGNFAASKEFGNFATTKPSEDEEFGNFTTSKLSEDEEFGNFTANEFGNFATSKPNGSFATSKPNGSFATSKPSEGEEFGNFATSKSNEDEEFGNFATSKPNEEFGNFATSKPSEDEEFGNFATSKPSEDEEFGNFTTSKPSEDEEFGNFATSKPSEEFGNFSTSKPVEDGNFATSKPSEDEEFGNFDSSNSTSAPSTVSGKKIKVVSMDVMVACFPRIGQSPQCNLSQPVQILKGLLDDKAFSQLFQEINSTSSLYQWNQSLLQDRFFNSLKVDPMLVPSGGGVGDDPFALSNLLDDLGINEIAAAQLNRKASEGGATLLDLSLPLSPTGKDDGDSKHVLLDEDLKELDFNASGQFGDVSKGDTPTSWMDSELLELEKELPATTASTVSNSNFDWLNNPELTTMVKPSIEVDLLNSDSQTGSMGAGLDLLPSSKGFDLVSNSSSERLSPYASVDLLATATPTKDQQGIDLDILESNMVSSPSPDPMLIPPDPILAGSLPPDPAPDPAHNGLVPPDPILTGSFPPSTLHNPSPDPTPSTLVDDQTTVASQGLNIVMEMTNTAAAVSNSSPPKPVQSKGLSLVQPLSSIDILEDHLLEMTAKKKDSVSDDKLSDEAQLLLSKLPCMTFMRR